MAYGESIKLCRVYEKTSKNGNTYMAGRLAGAKIAILKSRDVADDGGAIWDVMLTQAQIREANGHAPELRNQAEQQGIAETSRPLLDDAIPF